MRTLVYLLTTCVVLTSSIAHADLLTLDTLHQGHMRSSGSKTANQYLTTGWVADAKFVYRSFVAFDLSDFAGDIESATLRLEVDLYSTTKSLQTININQIDMDPQLFANTYQSGDATGLAIYQDLGSGPLYSNLSFRAQTGDVVEFDLNSTAIANLNNAIGDWIVMGIAVANPITSNRYHDVVRFSTTGHELVLTYTAPEPPPAPAMSAPEPATLVIWLLLIVPACVWGLRKRSQLAS